MRTLGESGEGASLSDQLAPGAAVKPERAFGPSRVARILGVDRATIRRWWRERGLFPRAWLTAGGKLRVPVGDVESALAGMRRGVPVEAARPSPAKEAKPSPSPDSIVDAMASNRQRAARRQSRRVSAPRSQARPL